MWTKDLFGTDKPVIGMVHLHAMPTDPKYDPNEGVEGIVEAAKKDIIALQEAGFDGLLFCNEFAIPYTKNTRIVTVATYARVIGELKSIIKVPFGITYASNVYCAFDIAAATGANFVRAHYHDTTAGVFGMSNPDPGDVERHRCYVGCKDIPVLQAVIPEGTEMVAPRPIKQVVKTLCFNVNPDGLLIYSTNPGADIDTEMVELCKQATDKPILASNGVKPNTVANILAVADGCIVGTGVKYDGNFYNPVDPARAKELMENARKVRGDK